MYFMNKNETILSWEVGRLFCCGYTQVVFHSQETRLAFCQFTELFLLPAALHGKCRCFETGLTEFRIN
jgi:hypothetical protein